MLRILLTLLLFSTIFTLSVDTVTSTKTFDHNFTLYAEILSNRVKNGLVDYKGLNRDRNSLDTFLRSISVVNVAEFNRWKSEQRLSFLINLYNAATLRLIVDHYPVNSIKDIKDPWSSPEVKLFDEKISLDHLEHELIRKKFNEPTIHFALVCAAKGCPVLINEPYLSNRLEGQLKSSTREFMNRKDLNYVDHKNNIIFLSPIFDWFKDDFEKKYGSVKKFVTPYLQKAKSNPEDLDNYAIQFTNYDWSLNSQ